MSDTTNIPKEPTSISEYLSRMLADAESIDKRLMEAPVDLTGSNEPKLYELLVEIKTLLNSAQALWPNGTIEAQ